MLSTSLRATKQQFLDRPIRNAAEAGHIRLQSKFGAFVRRRMQSSLKYSKKDTAAPGQPPKVHKSGSFTRQKTNKKTGVVTAQAASPLRELIFFALDSATRSVVIGPVQFGRGEAPGLLEFGGRTSRTRKSGTKRELVYAPHPFVKPAGDTEAKGKQFRTLMIGMVD